MFKYLMMLLLAGGAATAESTIPSVTIGDYRIQALSPTLLRVEPKGPKGFEDRTTFMVVDRTSWTGTPITKTATGGKTATWEVAVTPPGSVGGTAAILVTSTAGKVLYNSSGLSAPVAPNLLHWPPPNSKPAYGLADYPRFFVPEWDLMPAPKTLEPALKSTNGYDFGNSVNGDTYIFLLGDDLESWSAARKEFVQLAGPCPVLPDFAFGTWFTWWQFFSMEDSKSNVTEWQTRELPIDVWALDMNWRNTTDCPPAASNTSWTITANMDGIHDVRTAPNTSNADVTFLGHFETKEACWSKCNATTKCNDWTWYGPLYKDWGKGCYTMPDGVAIGHAWPYAEVWQGQGPTGPSKVCDRGSGPGHPHPEVGRMSHYYDHPNSALFPGNGTYGSSFTEWFDWLKTQKLHTYFNDHPFPVATRGEGGLQTSPEEVAFRWEGLTSWLERGLTTWWFDHNWGFSIPPPFVNTSQTSGDWQGLDNAAWGSHVYYSTVAQYSKIRIAKGDTWSDKPMTLTKFGIPDWKAGMDPVLHQESPAQHRYPVWWTGDYVTLLASVESMVDSGVHDFKPYVHSDCGGDYHGSGGDLLRWTAHCAFGTVLRYHGNDHRPWVYGDEVTDTIRSYLTTRYKLAPSLIAAGQHAAQTGFPFVTRGDMIWPEHAENTTSGSSSSSQYIFLNDTLVAPIWISTNNATTRAVWIPPGDWEDAWDGSTVTGPKTIQATQPYEKQPMWHKKAGGLTVMTDKPGLRINDGDWSTLTLEAFPGMGATPTTTERSIYALQTEARTELSMSTEGVSGQKQQQQVHFEISTATDAAPRAWVVRVHLEPGQRVVAAVESVMVHDGGEEAVLTDLMKAVEHLAPLSAEETARSHFPFGGTGVHPPVHAGHIAELRLASAVHARTLSVSIGDQ